MRTIIIAALLSLFIFTPARVEAQSCVTPTVNEALYPTLINPDGPGLLEQVFWFSQSTQISSLSIDMTFYGSSPVTIAPVDYIGGELVNYTLIELEAPVSGVQTYTFTPRLADAIYVFWRDAPPNAFTINSISVCGDFATPTSPAPTPVPNPTGTPRPMLPPLDVDMNIAFQGINYFFSPFFGGLIFLFMIVPALAVLKWLIELIREAFNDD